MPEIRWSRFQFDPEAVIVIIYLNSLNAGLNDDITHFPHWEYIAGISDSPMSMYVGGIPSFSKNMGTTTYGMNAQY